MPGVLGCGVPGCVVCGLRCGAVAPAGGLAPGTSMVRDRECLIEEALSGDRGWRGRVPTQGMLRGCVGRLYVCWFHRPCRWRLGAFTASESVVSCRVGYKVCMVVELGKAEILCVVSCARQLGAFLPGRHVFGMSWLGRVWGREETLLPSKAGWRKNETIFTGVASLWALSSAYFNM